MTEEQQQALGDLEEIIRCDETTNTPHRGMSKVKHSSDEASYHDICDFNFTRHWKNQEDTW